MIWQWDGDPYRVLLPPEEISKTLREIGKAVDIQDKLEFSCYGLNLAEEDGKYIMQSVFEHSELPLFSASWSVSDPDKDVVFAEYDGYCQFHIMLQPLDKHGMPIDHFMLNAYPDGEIIENGYMYHDEHPLSWPVGLNALRVGGTYSIRDTAPDDKDSVLGTPVYRKLRWIFVQGYFVSMPYLFMDSPKEVWKWLYSQK